MKSIILCVNFMYKLEIKHFKIELSLRKIQLEVHEG